MKYLNLERRNYEIEKNKIIISHGNTSYRGKQLWSTIS